MASRRCHSIGLIAAKRLEQGRRVGAGLIEKAASLLGKAGQRSLARSALVEAAEQFTRGLALTAAGPITLIEEAEELGDPIEDPLLLFSVLHGLWLANFVAFNSDVVHELAQQFMTLAKKQPGVIPVMIGHRLLGTSLLSSGNLPAARKHYDKAIALYDPAEHRPQVARLGQEFGQDSQVVTLTYRSLCLWTLGYPSAAVADVDQALSSAREIGHAASLIFALTITSTTHINCANYAAAREQLNEGVALANEKGAMF